MDSDAKLARFRSKPALLVGALLVAAALIGSGVVVTGALFTSQVTVTGQDVATATVEIQADTSATSTPIQVVDLLPGDTSGTVISLENSGSAGVYYAIRLPLDADVISDAALADELEVSVNVGGVVETHTLSQWQTGAFQIGDELEDGDDQQVLVDVSLPSTTGNTLQGLSASFTVQFDAIQARNTPKPDTEWILD